MRHLKPCHIAIGTISTEDIDLEALLEHFEIFNVRPHELPESFNVALQRIGFGQRWPEVPRVVTSGGRPWPVFLPLAMRVRRLYAKALADLLKRNVVAVNAQLLRRSAI